MGKTLEVFLSDVQHAQLTAEAAASGLPFFGYCRDKLAAPLAPIQKPSSPKIVPQFTAAPAPQPPTEDRISRIEDAVNRLTDIVLQGHAAPDQAQPQEPSEPFDVDSIVNAQFNEAEAAGVAEYHESEVDEVMRLSGMRPLARKAPRYSPEAGPRHILG